MAGALFTLSFASRQADIPYYGIVNLKVAEGDCRAEYITGSEAQMESGAWSYQFLIQEDDLPGSLELTDINNDAIIAPYWSSLDITIDTTAALSVRCFEAIPEVTTVAVDGYIAIIRHDVDCDCDCLEKISHDNFVLTLP